MPPVGVQDMHAIKSFQACRVILKLVEAQI